MTEQTTLGAQCARTLVAKDSERMLALMHPEIDFRGMTPGINVSFKDWHEHFVWRSSLSARP